MNSNTMFSLPTAVAGLPLPFDALPAQVSAGVPVDLLFTVLPAHPSNQLVVEQTSSGGDRVAVRAWPDGCDPVNGTQRFRVRMPPLAPDETAQYAPMLTRAGLLVQSLPVRSTRGYAASAAPAAPDIAPPPAAAQSRYEWASDFLGAFTVRLIKPAVSGGPCPDGLRINYQIESGEIRGPKINAKVRGGDWLVLRPDGVGVPESRVTYETDDGALLLSRYSGCVDLGADGYARALRNEFDPDPPAVLTPQFSTSHPSWLWLNRLQCLAVGRASMTELIVRLDIYAIRVGQPLPSSGLPRIDAPPLVGDVH